MINLIVDGVFEGGGVKGKAFVGAIEVWKNGDIIGEGLPELQRINCCSIISKWVYKY